MPQMFKTVVIMIVIVAVRAQDVHRSLVDRSQRDPHCVFWQCHSVDYCDWTCSSPSQSIDTSRIDLLRWKTCSNTSQTVTCTERGSRYSTSYKHHAPWMPAERVSIRVEWSYDRQQMWLVTENAFVGDRTWIIQSTNAAAAHRIHWGDGNPYMRILVHHRDRISVLVNGEFVEDGVVDRRNPALWVSGTLEEEKYCNDDENENQNDAGECTLFGKASERLSRVHLSLTVTMVVWLAYICIIFGIILRNWCEDYSNVQLLVFSISGLLLSQLNIHLSRQSALYIAVGCSSFAVIWLMVQCTWTLIVRRYAFLQPPSERTRKNVRSCFVFMCPVWLSTFMVLFVV